jgi:hypothetical protein
VLKINKLVKKKKLGKKFESESSKNSLKNSPCSDKNKSQDLSIFKD